MASSKVLSSVARKEGMNDLRTEFLFYAPAVDAVGIIRNEVINPNIIESVHDPDEDKDLVYIKTYWPIALVTMASEIDQHCHSSRGLAMFHAFKGKGDPQFKEQLDFLERAKTQGDPTYIFDEL